jgi:hypothetical protein
MPDNVVINQERSNFIAKAQNDAWFPPNITNIQNDFGAVHVPIYIYNVGPLEHKLTHPRKSLVKACPSDKPYILAGQLEHPFRQVRRDQNGEKEVYLSDGYRIATIMLSPSNPGSDQNWSEDGLAMGANLNNQGVFWSVNNPPTEQELKAAVKRMEDDFTKELAKMVRIEAEEGAAAAQGRANYKSRAAADYYQRSFSWHRNDQIPRKKLSQMECAACGESISSIARICKECGAPTDPEKLERWLDSKLESKTPAKQQAGAR